MLLLVICLLMDFLSTLLFSLLFDKISCLLLKEIIVFLNYLLCLTLYP